MMDLSDAIVGDEYIDEVGIQHEVVLVGELDVVTVAKYHEGRFHGSFRKCNGKEVESDQDSHLVSKVVKGVGTGRQEVGKQMSETNMKYGMIVESLAHIHTGVTVKIKSQTCEGCGSGLYLLADGEHCDAMPKRCIGIISKDLYDFFQPRTDAINKFIAEND